MTVPSVMPARVAATCSGDVAFDEHERRRDEREQAERAGSPANGSRPSSAYHQGPHAQRYLDRRGAECRPGFAGLEVAERDAELAGEAQRAGRASAPTHETAVGCRSRKALASGTPTTRWIHRSLRTRSNHRRESASSSIEQQMLPRLGPRSGRRSASRRRGLGKVPRQATHQGNVPGGQGLHSVWIETARPRIQARSSPGSRLSTGRMKENGSPRRTSSSALHATLPVPGASPGPELLRSRRTPGPAPGSGFPDRIEQHDRRLGGRRLENGARRLGERGRGGIGHGGAPRGVQHVEGAGPGMVARKRAARRPATPRVPRPSPPELPSGLGAEVDRCRAPRRRASPNVGSW